jgi:hypothetical protein
MKLEASLNTRAFRQAFLASAASVDDKHSSLLLKSSNHTVIGIMTLAPVVAIKRSWFGIVCQDVSIGQGSNSFEQKRKSEKLALPQGTRLY